MSYRVPQYSLRPVDAPLPKVKPIHQHPIQLETTQPNPFTYRPIQTQWKGNYLLMKDPKSRVTARIAPLDIGKTESSNFLGGQHLMMGWTWCGAPENRDPNDYEYCRIKNSKMTY